MSAEYATKQAASVIEKPVPIGNPDAWIRLFGVDVKSLSAELTDLRKKLNEKVRETRIQKCDPEKVV